MEFFRISSKYLQTCPNWFLPSQKTRNMENILVAIANKSRPVIILSIFSKDAWEYQYYSKYNIKQHKLNLKK
jgi:hypothetical protein